MEPALAISYHPPLSRGQGPRRVNVTFSRGGSLRGVPRLSTFRWLGERAVSSLRPLATIALLAAVGVFLYMKINDSEPKLSPELETWSTSTLEVGAPDGLAVGAPTPGAIAAGAATQPAALAGDDAPPFMSATLSPAPTTRTAAAPTGGAGDIAPAWSPGPVATATQSSGNGDADSSPVARSADTTTPALPEMPPAPGGPESLVTPTLSAATTPDLPPTAAVAAGATAAAAAAADSMSAASGTAAVETPSTSPTTSMFSAARVAVQGALDRGELSQALLYLSEWYGDPSLTPAESDEVNQLLSQLAGSVIYEGPPAHRLLPAHIVQAGETLETVASKYDVPRHLLAKINGVSESDLLAPGQELKVVPGPFSARIDMSERKMTLMLDRRYAGQFPLEIDPAASIEEGEWKVDQKLLTPRRGGLYGAPAAATEDRSLLLANLADPAGASGPAARPGQPRPHRRAAGRAHDSAEGRRRQRRLRHPVGGLARDDPAVGDVRCAMCDGRCRGRYAPAV